MWVQLDTTRVVPDNPERIAICYFKFRAPRDTIGKASSFVAESQRLFRARTVQKDAYHISWVDQQTCALSYLNTKPLSYAKWCAGLSTEWRSTLYLNEEQSSRQLFSSKTAESRLRCTEIDKKGQIIFAYKEVRKHEIIAKVNQFLC
jgi:hypothetical protein